MSKIFTKPREDALRTLVREVGAKDSIDLFRKTGILLPLSGGAFGYNEAADVPYTTVDGYDIGRLYDEIQQSVALLNAARRPLVDRLTFQVTTPVEGVPQLTEDDFEEADEFAQPKGIRPGKRWNMGYDLRYFDLGIRYTFRFLGTATAADIRQLNNQALEADQRLIYKTLMSRIFRNVTDVHTLEGGTPVNVYPFYNGDNPVAPPKWNYQEHQADHNHYLVSGAADVDSGDVDDMEGHIRHHGYAEGADLILLAHSQETAKIRKFRVADGDSWDFIPAPNGPSFILDGQIVGGLQGQDPGVSGLRGFIGKYGRVNVVEEDRIPPGYLFMFASGGTFAERNPVGIRQHPNEALRGLKLIPQFERYPLREAFYHHALGSGVRHRGAGVVMQVKASGDYEIPEIELGGPGGR
jgi:hypothetical protein